MKPASIIPKTAGCASQLFTLGQSGASEHSLQSLTPAQAATCPGHVRSQFGDHDSCEPHPDSEAGSIHFEVVTDDDPSFPTLADLVQILLVGKAGLCSGAVIQNQKSGLGLPRNLGQL